MGKFLIFNFGFEGWWTCGSGEPPQRWASAKSAKGFADEITRGQGGVETLQGLLGFGCFVAESQKRQKSVLRVAGEGGRGTFRGGTAGEGVEGGEFVAKFENDSFGCFFAKTFEFGERGGVARGDGVPDGLRGGTGEDGEGGFGANPRDVMQEEAKEISFPGGEETVESMGVLTHDKVGEETDFFSRFGEVIEGGDGDEEFVADALAVDDRAGGPSFGQGAFEKRDHPRRLPEPFGRKRPYGEGGSGPRRGRRPHPGRGCGADQRGHGS